MPDDRCECIYVYVKCKSQSSNRRTVTSSRRMPPFPLAFRLASRMLPVLP
ncbi:hypothetical protein SJA_C1-20780 [Sphingobium indicum UT26S]|uniref:Uncharacterized protein n=1 Tax=Sphingobium indicum (strain DSM 16413 / CCM 7287 / MTCC 6362 / UT26 / NBRC 101211 / UT26S) TaxID=452662 RepID=D4Z2T0_SPHIU|nr:hypothetical protein SJA_C1-20780 [Sphingobium indicum UT26S]